MTKPNKFKVLETWKDRIWPPSSGTKVRLFQPLRLRGNICYVVANEYATWPNSEYRLAPRGKIRVLFKGCDWIAAKYDVYPLDISLEELLLGCPAKSIE